MAFYSHLDRDQADKPLPSLPSPTLTNPDMVLPDNGFPRLLSSPGRTTRRAPETSYMRDKSDEHSITPITPIRDQQKEKRGLMSRKLMLVRSQTGSATGPSFAQTLVPRDDQYDALASSPLLHDQRNVASAFERRGSGSSLDSDEMAKMPEFLQKYRNVDVTDDEATDAEGYQADSAAYDEQRKAKEEEEQVSALLSKRAEEILANAKKRLNLMEGNLRGARDLVAPLTAANLKRATSLSSSFGPGSLAYTHRRLESMTYDPDPYNPSQRILHSQASSPVMRHDYLGHNRGASDLEIDRPHTSLSRSRFPIRTPTDQSPEATWNANLRATRSHDSLGMNKLLIPADGKQARMKSSPDSSLEPVSENGGQTHIETSYRNSFRAPEVVPPIGLGVSHLSPSSMASSSPTEDLQDQMASLKGRISSLRERAREDSIRRADASKLRNSSLFSNASHDAPQLWYNQSSSRESLPLAAPETPPLSRWPYSVPTGSRNAFAELAARQQQDSGSNSPSSGYAKLGANSHKRTRSGTAVVEPAYHRFSHHQYKGSAEMPGAFNDPELLSESEGEGYGDDTFYEDASPEGSITDYTGSSDSEEDGEEEGAEPSVYEDAEDEKTEFVAHEDREDAFDYEHFFLHSAMGSYNSGRISPDTEVSDTASVSSTATAKAPQTQGEAEGYVEEGGEAEEAQTPDTPDALRQMEARLQHQHDRSMSSASMSSLNTFATADESRSGSRLDWSSPASDTSQPSTAWPNVMVPTPPIPMETDCSSDRADSGVGGVSRAAGPSRYKDSANAASALSAPTSPATTVDPTALAFKALLDPAGKDLHHRDKAVLSGLIESLRRVCVRLQEENDYESKVLRRRVDDARRVLDGLGMSTERIA